MLNEVELMHLAIEVFQSIDLNVQIKINNRKILTGIAEAIGEQEHIIAITVALDKFDKIGIDGVNQELRQKNISEAAIQKLQPIITTQGNNAEQLNALRLFLVNSEIGKIGIQEIETVLQAVGSEQLIVDITLARGLNYYTGAIFEVKALNATLSSSISGGGRYDNLTGIFGLENMSGVGISFGVDRIYDVMLEQQKFKHLEKASDSTQVVLTHFGENEQRYCMTLAKRLRKAGINTEVYPDLTKKITKQFEYANKKQVPYVIVIGDEEIRNGLLTVKNMETGTQERMTLEQLITSLKQSN